MKSVGTKSAASCLVGLNLDGWKVLELIPPSATSTGGFFSIGYKVERDGKKGFLKALDYSGALNSPDPARTLQAMTEAYNFERDMLGRCKDKKLDRIVRALADGSTRIDPGSGPQVVQYIIFEWADGDLRKVLDAKSKFDLAWSLRSLHHLATGLTQLHGENIAHQDLKPSNVLIFEGHSSKIGDVGRAACKGHTPPHENHPIAGDIAYAPLELRYGHVAPEWNIRRLGCDAYLLGNMVMFFFMNANMSAAILSKMRPAQHPSIWKGTFTEALPYIRDAFNQVLAEFESLVVPSIREDLARIVRQLCEPDPLLRGHPEEHVGFHNPYSLERYISAFDRLAVKAEYGLL